MIQVKYRRRMISKGIWAPADNILVAKQEVAAKRSTPAYANERKRELARRQAKQTAYTQEFNDEIIKFLNFHPRYEKEARRLGKIITTHATGWRSAKAQHWNSKKMDHSVRWTMREWP
nr:hypothetical protein [uncultured Desulfobacter sp.]